MLSFFFFHRVKLLFYQSQKISQFQHIVVVCQREPATLVSGFQTASILFTLVVIMDSSQPKQTAQPHNKIGSLASDEQPIAFGRLNGRQAGIGVVSYILSAVGRKGVPPEIQA